MQHAHPSSLATLKTLTVSFILAALMANASAVGAQTGGDYDLTWNTLDAGGVLSSTGGSGSNSYQLAGTIGQPDAGQASGGSGANAYVLASGFWPSSVFRAYAPVVLRP